MANQNFQIQTNSLVFFDTQGIMLKLSFLDNALSVSFGFPKVENDKRTYPKEERKNFILTQDRVAAIHKIIEKKALPAYDEDRNYNGGVFTSKRKDAIFEVAVKEGNFYVLYHEGISESRLPKATYVFQFAKTDAIEAYNSSSGEFEKVQIEGQFTLFVKAVEGFADMINNSGAHAQRVTSSYITNKYFSYLNEIATKLGCSVPGSNYSSGAGNNTGFDSELPFGDNSSGAMTMVDSMDGLFN